MDLKDEKEVRVDMVCELTELNCKLGFLARVLNRYEDSTHNFNKDIKEDIKGFGFILGDLEMNAYKLMQEAEGRHQWLG